MKTTMKSFFEEVLKIEYTSNTFKATDHESIVNRLLVKHGYNEVTKEEAQMRVSKKVRLTDDVYLKCLSEGEFVAQPYGSQNHPDFMVKHNNKLVKIECKASKGNAPTYNTTAPVSDSIYIFTSKKYGTTIFYGCDVLDEEMRESYKQMEKELWDVVSRYQETDLWKNNDRGFSFYMRNMFIQSGGGKKCNYFTHPDRKYCEQQVIDSF